MKKAFSTWYLYLLALIIFTGIFGICVIPYSIVNNPTVWPVKYCGYTALYIGVFIILGGFIAQDIYRAVIRKRTNNWETSIPQKNINTAWKIFMPILLSGGVAIIVGLLIGLFAK